MKRIPNTHALLEPYFTPMGRADVSVSRPHANSANIQHRLRKKV